jgi:subtilisin family serine protease
VLGAAVLAAALVVGGASPASAAGDQWWYDAYNVESNHADGWTGDGVKIAVLDTQIKPDLPVFAGANLTVDPEALCVGRSPIATDATQAHGSTITALLVGNGQGAAGIRGIVPDADVTFFGYGPEPEGATRSSCEVPPEAAKQGLSELGWGIQRAMDAGAQIISTSVLVSAEPADSDVVAEAVARGIILVSGMNNGGTDFAHMQLHPWGYRGVVAVNAMDANGDLALDTTWGIPNAQSGTTVVAAGVDVSVIGNGADWNGVSNATGTSIATPLVAGMLAATAQKYPKATGNQLLQSLIHNTGPEDHELEFNDDDGYGYGTASLSHMLRVDPTQYEDENPLLYKGEILNVNQEPSDEQFAAAEARVAAAAATSSPEAEPASADEGSPITGILIAGAIVVIVLLVGAAVVTILIVTRNNRKNRSRSLQ